MVKIAIQGERASFHHMAAREYFRDDKFEIVECATFRKLCKVLQEGQADLSVMAIENTLVGSLLPNYSLLQQYPFYIIGEIYLHIEQNLMALPGQKLADIHTVRSHPMALLQCSDFFEERPHLKSEETNDTAESARELQEKGLPGFGAIAGNLAAEMYHLEILARDIENLKHNYTRFLILSRKNGIDDSEANKASVNFHVKHRIGALAEALNIFQANKINLSLIQSIAIPRQPHEYAFHVDLIWERRDYFDQAMRQIQEVTKELQILGIYKQGVRPYDSYSQPA